VDRPLLTLYTVIVLGGFVVYEKDLDKPHRKTDTYFGQAASSRLWKSVMVKKLECTPNSDMVTKAF
jgi:hypothetical protein